MIIDYACLTPPLSNISDINANRRPSWAYDSWI